MKYRPGIDLPGLPRDTMTRLYAESKRRFPAPWCPCSLSLSIRVSGTVVKTGWSRITIRSLRTVTNPQYWLVELDGGLGVVHSWDVVSGPQVKWVGNAWLGEHVQCKTELVPPFEGVRVKTVLCLEEDGTWSNSDGKPREKVSDRGCITLEEVHALAEKVRALAPIPKLYPPNCGTVRLNLQRGWKLLVSAEEYLMMEGEDVVLILFDGRDGEVARQKVGMAQYLKLIGNVSEDYFV